MLRISLVVMAGVLALGAIGATFYGQSQVIASRNEDVKHRREIRETLGKYIERGIVLKNESADMKKPPPTLRNPLISRTAQIRSFFALIGDERRALRSHIGHGATSFSAVRS